MVNKVGNMAKAY